MFTELTPRSYDELFALAMTMPVYGVAEAGEGSGESAAASDELKKLREAQIYNELRCMEDLQLDVLGKVEHQKVKVFSRFHRQTETVTPSKMKYEELLEVAGIPAREKVVDTLSSDIPPGMYSMRDVRRAIATLGGYRKIDGDTELGAGVWNGLDDNGNPNNSVVIVGSNQAADWNGDKTLRRIEHPLARGHLLNFETGAKMWYDFDQLADLLQQAKDKNFRVRAMHDCINLFRRWRWKNEVSAPIVLTGLVFATWVQTLWEWRPQVSVIGPTSSGKSMFCKAVSGLFGNLAETCSDSTAAGIRQLIENSARVILFDEFDAEDKRQLEEQQKIMKMLRASGRGDAIFRGTSNQKGKKFTLRHIVWVLGIQIASPREADRNRYITAELLPPLQDRKGTLILPPASELAELGQRILASAIYCIHEAKRIAANLKDCRVPGVSDRIVESYAVPAAMLAAIEEAGEEDARAMLQEMLSEIAKEDHSGTSDEQTLMADILGAQIQIGAFRYSVAQLLEQVLKRQGKYDDAAAALESRGLKIDRFTIPGSKSFTGEPCFLIAHQIIAEHLIKNTKWGGQAIDQILKRLPSAVPSRRRVGGQRVQTVGISLDYLKTEYLGFTEADMAASQASDEGF